MNTPDKNHESRPTALLIGDSISLGYRDLVKFFLQDEVEVFYPPENARFVAYTFRALYEWSRDLNWSPDINFVYWNNGLWDVVRIFGDEPQTPLRDYEVLIERTWRRLRYLFPKATIIFATSTPVLESRFNKNIFYRRNEDIQQYNTAAIKIILSNGGIVHDLNKLASGWPEQAYEDGTHFIPQARQIMAACIAELLRELVKN